MSSPPPKVDRHAFALFPNYRTVEPSTPFQRITPKEKMALAARGSFDWSPLALSAVRAGFSQLGGYQPQLGQGAAGYGNRLGRAYADTAIGTMVSEGALPSLFREDPRYFRRGSGTFVSRAVYAFTRAFVTRTDAGKTRFNISGIGGDAIGAGISNAYYPDDRNVPDYLSRFGVAVGLDVLGNLFREFWPDVRQRAPAQSTPPQP